MTIARDAADAAAPSRGRLALSPAQRAFAWTIIVGMLVAFFFGHSAPSPLGTMVALAGAAGAGVAVAWMIRDGALFSMRGPVVWGLAGALFAYIALSGGYLWAVDHFLGAPAQRTVTITGWSFRSRYDCSHFSFAGEVFAGKPSTCAASSYREEAIAGRQLTLVGRATPLGMAVEGWRLGPRP